MTERFLLKKLIVKIFPFIKKSVRLISVKQKHLMEQNFDHYLRLPLSKNTNPIES